MFFSFWVYGCDVGGESKEARIVPIRSLFVYHHVVLTIDLTILNYFMF